MRYCHRRQLVDSFSGGFLAAFPLERWGTLAQVDLLSAPMPQSFQHMPWHEQAMSVF